MYLDKISKQHLYEFIGICRDVQLEFDDKTFVDIVQTNINYLKDKKNNRKEYNKIDELEDLWYKSLLQNKPDYSVYDDVYYLADTWTCWKLYSRNYIKDLLNVTKIPTENGFISIKEDIGNINKIVDLGCGIGYTTAVFSENFNCPVIGTNILDTKQYKICEYVSRNSNFTITDDISTIGNSDMVFASEYFEHFEEPVKHLIEVIETLNPRVLIFANSFNTRSIGHFNYYKNDNILYNGRQIGKLFKDTLISYGFVKQKTKCWNNTPEYYKR